MDASGLLFLGLIIAVFYLTMLRPQQKKMKQHQALVASVQEGDEVITIGGLHGVVKQLDDEVIWLEVAPGTTVRFSRLAVSRKLGGQPVSEEAIDQDAEQAPH